MVSGPPEEARWIRAVPHRALPVSTLERIVRSAFPTHRALASEPMAGGLRNSNFKLRLDSAPEVVVLRVYEHHASLCQKECDLLRLVSSQVPVPEVIHSEPRGLDGLPPFNLLEYVEGISLLELKRTRDADAIAHASYSAGETLAAIGRTTFGEQGWLGPGPAVTAPLLEGEDPMPRFVDLCLAATKLQCRMPAELRDGVHSLVWSHAQQLACEQEASRLVHGDFNKRNLLVRRMEGRWAVAAVVDWEFAVSGSPLADLGNFLRYERESGPLLEPDFSNGFRHAGGILPEGWRRLSRLIDLAALCESLTHDQLPGTVETELVELVHATVENRDPHFAAADALMRSLRETPHPS